jgi:hypothetical protein
VTGTRCRVVFLAAVIAVLTAACASSSHPRTASTINQPLSRASSAGITLKLPPGWAFRLLPAPGGLVVADSSDNLKGLDVIGPRLTVVPSTSAPTPNTLIEHLDRSPMYSPTVSQQTFGRFKDVPTVQFSTAAKAASGDTIEMIPMTVAPGKTYLVTLETPSATWSDERGALEAILSAAAINTADFPG